MPAKVIIYQQHSSSEIIFGSKKHYISRIARKKKIRRGLVRRNVIDPYYSKLTVKP